MKDNNLDFFKNIYLLLQNKESKFNDPTTLELNDYFKRFIDNYEINSSKSDEFLGNEELNKEFMDKFVSIYNSYKDKDNSKYVIPLFIYLYDQYKFVFDMDKFNSFVENEEISNFSDLLANYDVYKLSTKTI